MTPSLLSGSIYIYVEEKLGELRMKVGAVWKSFSTTTIVGGRLKITSRQNLSSQTKKLAKKQAIDAMDLNSSYQL
jgi:hypothetical protein